MNISSTTLATLTGVTSTAATTRTSTTTATDTDTAGCDATGDRSKVSELGQLLGSLKELADSDPAKAKAVLTQIADALDESSEASGDTKMGDLADKFRSAAETGDLSSLEPPKGRPPGPPPGAPPGPPPSELSEKVAATYGATDADPMATITAIIKQALEA